MCPRKNQRTTFWLYFDPNFHKINNTTVRTRSPYRRVSERRRFLCRRDVTGVAYHETIALTELWYTNVHVVRMDCTKIVKNFVCISTKVKQKCIHALCVWHMQIFVKDGILLSVSQSSVTNERKRVGVRRCMFEKNVYNTTQCQPQWTSSPHRDQPALSSSLFHCLTTWPWQCKWQTPSFNVTKPGVRV